MSSKSIQTFDRTNLRELRATLDKELELLGDRLGVKLTLPGNCTFTPRNCTFKLEASVIGSNGEVHTKDAEDFRRMATLYGLEASDLGRSFRKGGKTWKVVGLMPRSRRCPIVCEDGTGKRYRLPPEDVRMFLKVAAIS